MKDDFGSRFNERFENRKKRWEARMESRGRHGHIWTGLFIILIGVAALVKASFTNLPDWIFSWQVFLIILGFFLGLKHSFKGSAWLILILIGSGFLIRDFYPDLSIRRYIWPSVLVLIGGIILLRPRHRNFGSNDFEKKSFNSSGVEDATIIDEAYNTKEDFLNSTCILSGCKKIIISKNFKGGDVVSIFGGTELDLSQADMSKPAVIEITTIFGGTKLIIPSNWDIKTDVVNILGGIEDKRRMQTVTGQPEKTLILKGTVLFGGIEIKSY